MTTKGSIKGSLINVKNDLIIYSGRHGSEPGTHNLKSEKEECR